MRDHEMIMVILTILSLVVTLITKDRKPVRRHTNLPALIIRLCISAVNIFCPKAQGFFLDNPNGRCYNRRIASDRSRRLLGLVFIFLERSV